MSSARIILLAALLLTLAACGDNLNPSGSDRRSTVTAGSSGPAVGQLALPFTVSDTAGTSVSLASALAGRRGAVFYFTMWCPICDSHMSSMRAGIIPLFPDVGFYAVDYVSGTVSDAANGAISSGYGGGEFLVLADTAHQLQSNFQATMGTTVVVDPAGVIRMSEDYRDGSRLTAALNNL